MHAAHVTSKADTDHKRAEKCGTFRDKVFSLRKNYTFFAINPHTMWPLNLLLITFYEKCFPDSSSQKKIPQKCHGVFVKLILGSEKKSFIVDDGFDTKVVMSTNEEKF